MSSDKPTLKQRYDRLMLKHGRVLVIGLPYLWLMLFFLIPFLIVLKISFATAEYAQPPYSALFTWIDEGSISRSISAITCFCLATVFIYRPI